jgi:SPP1 gp7 family putative phage head morphogenesis protein
MDLADIVEVWIKVQRLGNGIANQVVRITDDMTPAARKIITSNQSIKKKTILITKLVKKTNINLEEIMAAQLAEVGIYVQAGMITALGPAANKIRPVAATKTRITRALNHVDANNISAAGMIRSMGFRQTQALTNIIHRGFEEGLSNQAMGAMVKDVGTTTARQATAIARTATNAVSNTMLEDMYASTPLIDRVLMSAVLDHRTTDICMQMDGQIYKKGEGPRPPFHVQCRTVAVPVFTEESNKSARDRMTPRTAVVPKSAEAIKEKGIRTKGGKVRKPNISKDKGDSPLYRKTTNATSYQAWLRQQPKAYQVSILGKSAAEDFRKGKTLGAVLGNRKSAVTVKQLTAKAL